MRVAEGQSVTISCVVTGKPDPVVTWFRDTTLITGGRFKIMSTGSLKIEVSFVCSPSKTKPLNVLTFTLVLAWGPHHADVIIYMQKT